MIVRRNPDLAGRLPDTLTRLSRLRRLDVRETALCAPTDTAFHAWLESVERYDGDDCTDNRSPRAVGSIPAQTLKRGGSAVTVNVAQYFTDPDGDSLTYSARSSARSTVSVSVSGSDVTLTPVAAGTATVTVTALDTGELTATQRISVTVESSGSGSACRVGQVLTPGESCTNPTIGTFTVLSGGCASLSVFGGGRLCAGSINANGFRATRVNSVNFRIDALP